MQYVSIIIKQAVGFSCLMLSISIDIILISGHYHSVSNRENTEKAARMMALAATALIALKVIAWTM